MAVKRRVRPTHHQSIHLSKRCVGRTLHLLEQLARQLILTINVFEQDLTDFQMNRMSHKVFK